MSRARAKVKEAEPAIPKPYWTGGDPNGASWHLYNGDSSAILKTLPAEHFHCVVTSPPYFWLRDYNVEGQIGHEEDVTAYVDALAAVMDEVYRVLRRDGLVFLNLGDTYYSGKGKSHGIDPKERQAPFWIAGSGQERRLRNRLAPKVSYWRALACGH